MSFNVSRLIRSQSGKAESKTPMVVTLVIIAIIGFLGYKLIPVKIKSMKFEQEIIKILNIDYAHAYKEYARGGFNEYTMREMVLEAAKKLHVPIKDADKQVDVQWPENKQFTVRVKYDEEISFPIVGKKVWKFNIYAEQDLKAGKAIVE